MFFKKLFGRKSTPNNVNNEFAKKKGKKKERLNCYSNVLCLANDFNREKRISEINLEKYNSKSTTISSEIIYFDIFKNIDNIEKKSLVEIKNDNSSILAIVNDNFLLNAIDCSKSLNEKKSFKFFFDHISKLFSEKIFNSCVLTMGKDKQFSEKVFKSFI